MLEFPYGSSSKGSGVVTAVALVTAVVWIQSLVQELPHATSKKKKKKRYETYSECVERVITLQDILRWVNRLFGTWIEIRAAEAIPLALHG